MVFEFCCPNDGTPHWVDESCIGKEILCVTCSSMIEVQDQRGGVEPENVGVAAKIRKASANRTPIVSRKQKWVLLCGIALFVLSGLYPPWRFVLHGPYGISSSRSVGHWLSAPSYSDYHRKMPNDDFYNSPANWVEPKIDVQALAVEWVILLVITTGLVLLLKSSSTERRDGK